MSARKKGGKPAKPAKAVSALLDELVQRAKEVRKNAYAPYSKYKVGAALATKSGRIFEGCNVENSSFGGTICAERGAIMAMVAAGEDEPVAIAVVTQGEDPAAPCGICRQILSEFSSDLPIAMVGLGSKDGEHGKVMRLTELLPMQFGKADLKR